ncbi:YceI family protein [Flavobacterium chuncheonense]|uniref:YceI family protein n=1 Tax=Flavobacterium chuncheonense TaxID=2026653 RepID=A0ABW5YQH6_9FLAO
MKNFILYLFLLITLCSYAQNKRTTKSGEVTFEASVPSFEEVKATNKDVTCILNVDTGEIAALALMKGFHFKVALMEEHFNENYMESTKFPKGIFKGKIENFKITDLSESPMKYTINGTLEVHGKQKEITTTAYIKNYSGKIEIQNTFTVNTDDFDIKIPSVISKKVAKQVNVECLFKL